MQCVAQMTLTQHDIFKVNLFKLFRVDHTIEDVCDLAGMRRDGKWKKNSAAIK